MKEIDNLSDLIEHGHDIEFRYKGKMYSITRSPSFMEDFISFCEFDKEPTDVKTVDELEKVTRDGVTVLEMWESLTDEDVWIV